MQYGGPQGVRDKTWIRKPAELSGEREELIIDKNAEKQVNIRNLMKNSNEWIGL